MTKSYDCSDSTSATDMPPAFSTHSSGMNTL